MKLKQYLSIIAIAAIAASCTKQGPAGPTGQNGANGVANIYTQQYSVGLNGQIDWTYVAAGSVWTATFTESDITDNNSDAVEVYWSNSASATAGWLALPFSDLDAAGDQLSYGFNDNIITFSYYGNPNFSPSAYGNTATIYFKVTVIPPAIQVKYPNVNWKDATQASQVPEVRAALK